MRIRSTKPEFWRSKTIASVSWDARLVLKGLESYVDDNGVGRDDIARILGDVFVHDMLANSSETVARVSEAISELHQAGLIHRYTPESDPLLYVSNWENIQRIDKPGKGRLPRPDGTFDYGESVIRESVANPRESVAPGTGEQGNRGTVNSSSDSADAEPRPRPDVEELLDYLDTALKANEMRIPNRTQKNISAARLLIDRDGKTVEQIKKAIDFAANDEFWRGNIRSMSKLRDQWDQLRAQAMRKRGGTVTQLRPTNPGHVVIPEVGSPEWEAKYGEH